MSLSPRAAITLAGGALVAVMAALSVVASSRNRPVELVVEPAASSAAGVATWPDTVTVDLRRTDTVVIRNEDDEPFGFGGAVIAPGASLIQRFEEPGVYLLQCGAHAIGTLRFVVLGADGTITGRQPDFPAQAASPP